jgi:hypothetical protein
MTGREWDDAWGDCSSEVLCWLQYVWDAHVVGHSLCKAPYTLSVKLSNFTVWCHTWQKNRVNCTVLTGSSTGLRTVLSSQLSHRELHESLRESHSFLSLHASTMMASSQEHRTIYSFSNTTSYSTFYTFFSSLRITLWLMWLANNSLVFIHHSHMHKKTHRTDKPDGRPVLCQRTFSSVFRAVLFYTFKLHSLN